MNYRKPDITNEATIQAKFYIACKEVGLSCDLQYSIGTEKGRDMPDFVLVECNEIIAIVEVKDYVSFNTLSAFSKDQIERYKKHDVPLFILYSVYDISYLIRELLELRQNFLKSIDSVKFKCFESDRQGEKEWDEKIDEAFSKFDAAFPGYKFTNKFSLEILATAVRVLGLPDLLKLIDESENVEQFFSFTNLWFKHRKIETSELVDWRHSGANNSIYLFSVHEARLARIDGKLK